MKLPLRVCALAALGILVAAAAASAGLPQAGTLVPGQSLGGIRLGETPHAVRAALGRSHGVCNNCSRTTWYFTYKPFDAHGLAVEFVHRRVTAVYTLSQPEGWHATNGVRLGATPLQVHRRAGALHTITCPGYTALVADTAHARSAYFINDGRLWAFGLFLPHWSPCR